MAMVDRATFEELLQRELDEDLKPRERRLLDAALESSPELSAERRGLQGLSVALEESQISVRSDFREQVMASLPAAAWEVRTRRSWRWPVALLAVLGTVAALLGSLSDGFAKGESVAGIFGAITSMVSMALVTGAGLLGASWRGLGAGLRELFVASPSTLVGVAILLVGLNALLFLGLRRRVPVKEKATSRRRNAS